MVQVYLAALGLDDNTSLLLTRPTDELYQLVVHMPDDVPFTCRVCKPCNNKQSDYHANAYDSANNNVNGYKDSEPAWKAMMQEELTKGLRNVLNAFVQTDEFNVLRSIGKVNTRCAIGVVCLSILRISMLFVLCIIS